MADGHESQIFERPSLRQRGWLLDVFRTETTGGLIMLVAAFIAMLWANSPWGDSYDALADFHIAVPGTHLDLSLNKWSADLLLAFFFYLAGLELKHEFVHGSLRDPAKAVVPIVAAISGMVVPALFFLLVAGGDEASRDGWGIPMATDIAFALAVLAIVGRGLPIALRAFLLTLAVVDDLGAIVVIATFYTVTVYWQYLAGAVLVGMLYFALQRGSLANYSVIFYVLFLAMWYLLHESGVHATVAGVAAGLMTRIHTLPGETQSPGDVAERRWRPFVAGIAVPLFAFFSAGVDLRESGFVSAMSEPVALAIVAGLVIGKPIGVIGGSWVMARFTKASLSADLKWADLLAVGFLAGIGFTVSLLVAELAYDGDPLRLLPAKTAVLAASVLSAILAVGALMWRNAAYRRIAEIEERDTDANGIPDIYEDAIDVSKPKSEESGGA